MNGHYTPQYSITSTTCGGPTQWINSPAFITDNFPGTIHYTGTKKLRGQSQCFSSAKLEAREQVRECNILPHPKNITAFKRPTGRSNSDSTMVAKPTLVPKNSQHVKYSPDPATKQQKDVHETGSMTRTMEKQKLEGLWLERL